jgi:aliphatic nitrilase
VRRDPAAAAVLDGSPRAASMFVDPTGAAIGDTLSDEEGIAYAHFELNRCIEPKQFHDVVGYYNRFDVFSLNVNRMRHEPVSWTTPSPVLTEETVPEVEAASTESGYR